MDPVNTVSIPMIMSYGKKDCAGVIKAPSQLILRQVDYLGGPDLII